jgi:hypothetical protein
VQIIISVLFFGMVIGIITAMVLEARGSRD